MRNVTFWLMGVPQRLLSRTKFCWTGIAMQKSLQIFPLCALTVSNCTYPCSCRLLWYHLVTVRMFSCQQKYSKLYTKLVGTVLHLDLWRIFFSGCRAALWRRRLLPARAVPLACFSLAQRKRILYTAVSWSYSDGKMQLLYQKRSSRNL